jgi:hypothetical protein
LKAAHNSLVDKLGQLKYNFPGKSIAANKFDAKLIEKRSALLTAFFNNVREDIKNPK